MRSVVIACTLRSGSNLLCELLARLGYGRPTEFFQHERYRNTKSVEEQDPEKLLTVEELHKEFVTLHDGLEWRGVKWNWFQFNILKETLAESESHADLEEWLPRPVWIRLSRRRLIDQAVSMYIAKNTGVWVSGDKARVTGKPLAYDFEEIWREFSDFATEEALWTSYLESNGIPYVSLVYEDLISDYGKQMRRVLAALDPERVDEIAPTDSLPTDVRNQPLRNEHATELAQKFEADLVARRHMRPPSSIALQTILAALTKGANESSFWKFVGDHTRLYPTIRKLELQHECKISGVHEWVEQWHFSDRLAVRLGMNASMTLNVRARRVMIEFLSHPWSGIVEVAVADGGKERVDLYNPLTTTRPWLLVGETTEDREIVIRPTWEKSEIADGKEVWVQRVWVLSD